MVNFLIGIIVVIKIFMSFSKIWLYLRQTAHNKISPTRISYFNYEKCFKTLLDSIDFGLINFTICFDGSLDEYNAHFTKKYQGLYNFRRVLIDTKSYTGKSYENDGSSKSSCLVAQIIKNDNLPSDSLIFTLENDYIFRPINWAKIVLDLYNNFIKEDTYTSCYEHLDTYIFNKKNRIDEWSMYSNLKSQLFLSNYSRWRVLPSITSSWIMSKNTFDRDIDLHSIGVSDNFGCQEFGKRGSICVSPIPSISTHSESWFMSPFENWQEIHNNTILL